MRMLTAGKLIHSVTVLRPPAGNFGTRGEKQGQAEVIYKNWPCSIVQTGGSESDQAGGTFSDATHEVEGYTDPKKPIKPRDYLLFNGRRLDISSVIDPEQNGLIAVLTCGEVTGEPGG